MKGASLAPLDDDLSRRIREHKTGAIPGFTAKYGCDKLVWFERFETRAGALGREQALKHWRRVSKLNLIEAANPTWDDLYTRLSA